MLGIFIGFLYLVFVVTSLLLIVIILLQEAKGGGLAGAFGGAGTEAFGVKAGGINRFTATMAGVMLASALLIGMFSASTGSVVSGSEEPTIPALPSDLGSTPTDSSAEVTIPVEGTATPPPASGTPPADASKPAEAPKDVPPAPSTPPSGEPEKK